MGKPQSSLAYKACGMCMRAHNSWPCVSLHACRAAHCCHSSIVCLPDEHCEERSSKGGTCTMLHGSLLIKTLKTHIKESL